MQPIQPFAVPSNFPIPPDFQMPIQFMLNPAFAMPVFPWPLFPIPGVQMPGSPGPDAPVPDFPWPQMPFVPFIQPNNLPIYQRLDIWHPDHTPKVDPSLNCLKAFNTHIKHLLKNPQPCADIFPDEEDATLVEVLLYGSVGTPYEGGFFHFSVRASPDYPSHPPRVAFRTASSTGRVRFGPNFYEKGCVCLSILGTWGGNTWQRDYTLVQLLHALQFRLSANPLDHEPAMQFKAPEERAEKSQQYSDQVAYETLRVAVCEQLERRTLPPALHQRAAEHFVQHYQDYIDRCDQLRKRLDGESVVNVYNPDPYEDTFEFSAVKRRMEKLLPVAKRDAVAVDN